MSGDRRMGLHLKHRSGWKLGVILLTCVAAGCGDDDATPTPVDLPEPTPTAAPTPTPTPVPEAPVSPFKILSSTPSEGAMAVPQGTTFTLIFNQALTADPALFESTLTADGGESVSLTADAAELSEDGRTLTYFAVGLAKDTTYHLDVSLPETSTQDPAPDAWPVTYHASFTTSVPCGVSFNIALGISIVQLGGNPRLASTLNGLLENSYISPVAMMFVDQYVETVFPSDDFKIVSGLAYKSKEEGEEGLYVLDKDYGFPVSMTGCDISASGDFFCGPQNFAFPIPITDETVLNLYLSDATVSGTTAASGAFEQLDGFMLTGYMTEDDIERISKEIGYPLDDLVLLDADTDGDGIADAATGIATSEPEWLQFNFCEPTAVE